MGKISAVLKTLFTKSTSAASATARIPLLNASGEPIGSDTMGNLASALGYFQRIKLITYIPDKAIINDIENSRVAAPRNSLFSGKSSSGQHEGGWYGYKANTTSDGDYGAIILFLGAYSTNFDVLVGKYETSKSAWEFYKVFV